MTHPVGECDSGMPRQVCLKILDSDWPDSSITYRKEVKSMSTQLQYAVFDWKDADELCEFLEIITED